MPRPRLIFLVTEDWYFIAHRLPMARAARDAGYDVHVATRVNRHGAAITSEGFQLHSIDWRRGSISPFSFLASIFAVRRLYKQLAPTLVHHIALQPAIVGSLAAWRRPIAVINSIVGLGSVFTSHGVKARIARMMLSPLLPMVLNRKNSITLVENSGHRADLMVFGVSSENIAVFPGSGVDTERLQPLREPGGRVTVAFAGRMLEDKGVRTLVIAHQISKERGKAFQLLLAGEPDPANPNSIAREDLDAWSQRPGVTWLGHIEDIRDLWAKAHIAVLASRGEGLPVSLLEAAACGRPIVASDIPGCREIARRNVNALLVPPDDPEALAEAIERLAGDGELRRKFGSAGRSIVEAKFSSIRVGDEIVKLYNRFSQKPDPT